MTDAATAQSVAPFESASELREEHAHLLEMLDGQLGEAASPEGEAAALAHLEPQIRRFLERGAATGVYLEEMKERTACQVLLDYWSASLAQAGLQGGSARLARFDGTQLPDLKDVRCPYLGLEAFRAQDHTYFFGRELDTKALLAQVHNAPLTVVFGASGSGKSSLVMGGVLPALAAEASGLRIVPPFVPGNAVLDHLVAALLQGNDGAPEAAALREDPKSLLALIGGEEAPPVLITIDQFEEVFTLCNPADREALVAGLAHLLATGRGHRVILTMREEFKSRIVELLPLSPYLEKAWCSMRPMGYDELRAAVEKPASLVNLQFQAGIVDDLVKKVLGQPAALPLLQFTLRLLWEKRNRNRITWEVYRKTGDPLNALKASADHFYDGLATETQDEIKRILLELVRVDELLEAYRQPVPMSRLLQPGKANTKEVLALLAKEDYVRISANAGGADPIVEVKHESLVRNWPRLVGWIDEKRVEQRQRLSLAQAARRWAESGRPPDGLLTGWQLAEAKSHSDLSALEEEFVQASAEDLERTQRQREEALRREVRRTYAALFVVLVITIVIAGAAYYIWERGRELARDQWKLSHNTALQNAEYKKKLAEIQANLNEIQAKYNDLFAKGVQLATQSELPSSQQVTIYLHISKEEQRPRAREIARQLQQNGIKVPGIQRVGGVTSSSVRYFRKEDEAEAQKIVRLLNDYLAVSSHIRLELIQGYEQKVPGQQYEIWFAPDALSSPQAKAVEPAPSPNQSVKPAPPPQEAGPRETSQSLQPELDRVKKDLEDWRTRAEKAERGIGSLQRLAVPPSFVVLGESSVQYLSLGGSTIALGTENLKDRSNEAWLYIWTSNLPPKLDPPKHERDKDQARQVVHSSGTCSAESVNGRSCYTVRRSDLVLNTQKSGEFVVGDIRYGIRATRWDNRESSTRPDRISLVVYAIAPN